MLTESPTLIAHFNLMLFDSQPCHLVVRKRDGLGGGPHKACAAADVPHGVPGLVRHHHFHDDVAGEDFTFYFLALSIGANSNTFSVGTRIPV